MIQLHIRESNIEITALSQDDLLRVWNSAGQTVLLEHAEFSHLRWLNSNIKILHGDLYFLFGETMPVRLTES